MALTLNAADQRRLQSASEAILMPLEYGDAWTWCRAVAGEVKALVEADTGSVAMPWDDGLMVYSDNPAASDYVAQIDQIDARIGVLRRVVELGAYDRTTLIAPFREEYLTSSYYNDWVLPNRFIDCVGLGVLTGPGCDPRHVGQLVLHYDSPARRFDRRAVSLLRFLLPAFRAGMRAWEGYARQSSSLAATLDSIDEAVLLCDERGRPVLRNLALQRLLAVEPEAGTVCAIAEQLASSVATIRRSRSLEAGDSVERIVRTASGSYTLHATYAGEGRLTPRPAILITVRLKTAIWPSPQDLAARFGLTSAQAQVTLLVAQGLSNAEIARTLVISPATARNHTARVREKLGVNSRARVASYIVQLRGSGIDHS